MPTAASPILSNSKSFDRFVPFVCLSDTLSALRAEGFTIAATNGCFDILHAGHVKLLDYASKLADLLVVGINSDSAVTLLKGPHRPINHESARAAVVAGLRSVDIVTIFNDVTAKDFLAACKPDIWVKGGDYTLKSLNQDEVKEVSDGGGKIRIVRLLDGVSTTAIEKRIRHG